MSEMSFEQMLDETFKTIHNGEVLEGKVISVRPDEAVLNIGYKADGILTSNEYSNTPVDLTTVISVGDELTVKVLKVNDRLHYHTRSLLQRRQIKELKKLLKIKKFSKHQLYRF